MERGSTGFKIDLDKGPENKKTHALVERPDFEAALMEAPTENQDWTIEYMAEDRSLVSMTITAESFARLAEEPGNSFQVEGKTFFNEPVSVRYDLDVPIEGTGETFDAVTITIEDV